MHEFEIQQSKAPHGRPCTLPIQVGAHIFSSIIPAHPASLAGVPVPTRKMHFLLRNQLHLSNSREAAQQM